MQGGSVSGHVRAGHILLDRVPAAPSHPSSRADAHRRSIHHHQVPTSASNNMILNTSIAIFALVTKYCHLCQCSLTGEMTEWQKELVAPSREMLGDAWRYVTVQ